MQQRRSPLEQTVDVLEIIALVQRPLFPKEVRDKARIEHPTFQRIIELLMARGFVEATQVSTSKRFTVYSITKQGTKALNRYKRAVRELTINPSTRVPMLAPRV